ncbi:PAS domain-containing protein [Sphingomonas sp. ABOLD]|uniref:histidine kinase n=1 Tax=Sphingomonas trueperi TaxID=53317 RepID=A0A7X5XXY2_9SPHN|nr:MULTISPECIES: PAS domain-containing sensor histidine kinase [Sphingomonas]NJB97033.1 signal transduction histidine kinase [Sphingomonas trueperi]RSV42806.1 PAS domain-containing protein [Sphingomonas sp. ABOLE]RSV50792.1 PAS domain-containing protein [Sphingomonas sp. ABOLD]
MIVVSQSGAAIVGAVLAFVLIAAVWALYAGLAARAAARTAYEQNRRLLRFSRTSPALPMLIRADGRIEMSPRLAAWLGLERPVESLARLSQKDAGLDPEDVALLGEQVEAAQRAGQSFRLSLPVRGSERMLLVLGERASEAVETPGSVLLWVLDATDSQAEVGSLEREADRLRAAFDALTALIEAAPMPMWYRGPDLRLLMVNTAYVRAVEGRDAEDVVSRGVELVDGAGLGGPLANAAIARDTQEPQSAAMPATIAGARRMLRLHDVPLPTGGIAGFAVDIEELERARGGLKRFAEAQRAMLDRMSAGVAQFGSDRSLVFCNQPFRRLFAMKNEWLADRPEFDRVLERMREARKLPDVRDFPHWKAERREWFTSPEAVEESWSIGTTHLRVVAQPLPEGGLLLIFEDQTQQLELQREHGEMQQVRTATLDSLAEAVAVFGKGRLQLWNRKFRQVWGFEDGFLDGHPQIATIVKAAGGKLVNAARAEIIGDLIRLAAKDRQQRGSSITFANGRHFDIAAVPLPDGNALVTMLDTTDRQRVERALRDRNEALEAADRVRTAFVANMSYELRTPLTSIKGFGEMLQGGFAGKLSADGKEYVEAILMSVDRLGGLIDDVLDLTQSEGQPIERETVDVELAATSAADVIAPLAKGKAIELVIEDAGTAGVVQGDARRIRQTVEHLLRHAVSHTPEGGRVLLHLDGNARVARVIVSDDGPGMAPEAVARAFDRFAQVGTSRGGDRALGLGLPLAKQFVEAHGGRIELISEPGQGTLVTVELPRG